MARKIPIKLSGAAVFMEGETEDFATGDITLPSLTPLTDSVSGTGLLGVIEMPTPGHYESMPLTITWKTITADAFKLLSSQAKSLEIRGAFSEFNNTKSALVTKAVKIVVRGFGKGVDLGTLVANAATDTTNTIEVFYIKIWVDGEVVFEHDKFNYISKINGKDDQEDIRIALGLN